MKDYIIFTDSSCDLPEETLKQNDMGCVPLSFKFEGDNRNFLNNEIPINSFYHRMRSGEIAKTSAINPKTFHTLFENAIKEQKDVLYIGFSSALSSTFIYAKLAAEELSAIYPKRRIIAIDSLCASAGLGLLINLIAEKKKMGYSIDNAAEYAESIKRRICHWFTVDDLDYLKRGGRVSPSSAFFGNMLGIKPILKVDNSGRLTCVGKVRGRRTSITTLAKRFGESCSDKEKLYISHADCQKEAEYLAKELKENHGAKEIFITDIGTVIGAHSGPGTIALFFIGNER